MPTTGYYEFKLAPKAKGGVIEDENDILPGEWAWIDRTADYEGPDFKGTVRWLMIYACCPDCKQPLTLYRRRGAGEPKGHDIDSQGNISPSVLHSWICEGVEKCGFHTMPTKLLGFVDLRGT
jgi:uncharacterized protein YbaR (Trm112 family)